MTTDRDVSRDELPIPDYDHLPVAGLASRIRSLPATDLETLLAYETAHGDRLPVTQVLRARLAEVEDGAELSGGDAAGHAPELAPAPDGGTGIRPGGVGPVQNPPSHGVPTNPAQPRT